MWAFTYLAFGRVIKLLLLCLRRRESATSNPRPTVPSCGFCGISSGTSATPIPTAPMPAAVSADPTRCPRIRRRLMRHAIVKSSRPGLADDLRLAPPSSSKHGDRQPGGGVV
jgi:hypothetical protein